MKNILCYGDSLTWGFDAETGGRHHFEDRWPTVLQHELGVEANVIAEGLNGRTTAFDDWTADCDRNGARILPTILHSHAPLDLVIIMLGTNDIKEMIVGTASASIRGMERLIKTIKLHDWQFQDEAPEILIVAPPELCETADEDKAAIFVGGIGQSMMFPTLLQDLADAQGCSFFDANVVCETTPIDGVHMDADNTRELGMALAIPVKLMLGL